MHLCYMCNRACWYPLTTKLMFSNTNISHRKFRNMKISRFAVCHTQFAPAGRKVYHCWCVPLWCDPTAAGCALRCHDICADSSAPGPHPSVLLVYGELISYICAIRTCVKVWHDSTVSCCLLRRIGLWVSYTQSVCVVFFG